MDYEEARNLLRDACGSYTGWWDRAEDALDALEECNVDATNALTATAAVMLPKMKKQLAGMRDSLMYADFQMPHEKEKVAAFSRIVARFNTLSC